MKKEAITAVLATLLAGPIGYYFNEWQTKDNISIEQVEATPLFSKITFNREIIRDLNMVYSFQLPMPISIQSYDWFGPELTNDQVNTILYQLEHISYICSNLLETYSRDLTFLKAQEPNLRFYQLASKLTPNYVPPIYDSSNTTTLDLIAMYEDKIQNVEQYMLKLSQHEKHLKDFDTSRTGEVLISTTLLNKGNTDGLIKRRAMLNIATYDQSIPLKIVDGDFHAGNHMTPTLVATPPTTIYKRSMNQVLFEVDKSRVNGSMLKELNALIKNANPFTFTVSLTDFRGDTIKSEPTKMFASKY
ncbi:hypothetical protein ACXAAV_12780 [Vibrio coralliilyticus]